MTALWLGVVAVILLAEWPRPTAYVSVFPTAGTDPVTGKSSGFFYEHRTIKGPDGTLNEFPVETTDAVITRTLKAPPEQDSALGSTTPQWGERFPTGVETNSAPLAVVTV